MKVLNFVGVICLSLVGCANFQRSANSGYSSSGVLYSDQGQRDLMRDKSIRQTAYELGKDPSYLNESDLEQIRNRQKARELERTLSSRKEKEQYSKVLPWLKGDEEKIAFLSVPSIEGRQQWINKNNIWDRSTAPKAEMKEILETQDIAVGMPQDYVRKSWGDPLTIEVSGNPIYKNERWKYERFTTSPEGYRKETRIVYFEGGRVVGWETQ
ncbi:MAG: hypothetical protein ACM3MG_03805 [Bacillota bacterium]